ncbi:hypothetical protein BJ508DRAFT_412521 [Ascobolus immersus RN42]|uniref:Uncharacterized protein n=1 Tax=Ascobolus immersus RN42 TaxID=1160509 RepID=A0A3N4IG33_ASCIM|nr:hypothetical protein BJ508DRAFT_412521 [Ascobolus immersus RN42]
MADVRKLLRAERAARTNKAAPSTSQKRPLESDTTSLTSQTARIDISSKRQKTDGPDASNPSNLPAGFFDEDAAAPKAADKSTSSKDKQEKQADGKKQDEGALPADFFGGTGAAPAVEGDVDEDEWAAFEAEVVNAPVVAGIDDEEEEGGDKTANGKPDYSSAIISAAPVLNKDINASKTVEEAQEVEGSTEVDELDDAREKLLEEFEEMESLEQRVLKLKEKREQLRHIATTVTPMETDPPAGKKGEEEEDEEEESDDDDDEDDWMRARGV